MSDAVNDAIRTGDSDAISNAVTNRWREIEAAPLRGPSCRPPVSSDRTPINVHPDVVKALRDLLFEDDMRGVGYSEFIARAIELAKGAA